MFRERAMCTEGVSTGEEQTRRAARIEKPTANIYVDQLLWNGIKKKKQNKKQTNIKKMYNLP